MRRSFRFIAIFFTALLCVAPPRFASAEGEELTIYSGRSKDLVQPVLDGFSKVSGVKVNVRYAGTTELATTLLEEGKNSPADLFFAQDAGGLGAVAAAGLFEKLPENLLSRVEPRFRSPEGLWTGSSGRVRVVAYNTNILKESDLPESVLGFTDPKWKGKIGWAPTNGSFQAFVTAMRVKMGDEATAKWLKAMKANEPRDYPNNSSALAAVGSGEVQAALVNHYYLLIFKKEKGESFPVKNYYPKKGDVGAMVNVAGVGVLKSSPRRATAEKFVDYLLSPEAQKYFVEGGKENEYPLIAGIPNNPNTVPLDQIESPDIDLGKLSDLQGTIKLLRDTGVLE